MLKSMTGFGRAESKDDSAVLQVEVRSVNNRFLKVSSKLPEPFLPYQERLERVLKDGLSRGSVYLNVEYKPLHEAPGFYMNLETLKGYYRSIKELRDELGPEGDVPLASLFSLPGICERTKVLEDNVEGLVPVLENLVSSALDGLLSMRIQEGKALEEEIVRSKERIMHLLDELEERVPEVVNGYRDRLKKRVSNLLQGVDVELSEGDLAREVAFFAERSDITEEITRLRSHITQLEDTMREKGPSGRRQEFIVQEMFREANTMGSKVSDGDMLRGIIDIKMEIEKIKEQVFNVE
ncbi:MAG: YicC/YloC family endoribonuclease [Candidatus Brocadiales bacterium]